MGRGGRAGSRDGAVECRHASRSSAWAWEVGYTIVEVAGPANRDSTTGTASDTCDIENNSIFTPDTASVRGSALAARLTRPCPLVPDPALPSARPWAGGVASTRRAQYAGSHPSAGHSMGADHHTTSKRKRARCGRLGGGRRQDHAAILALCRSRCGLPLANQRAPARAQSSPIDAAAPPARSP